ncbi:MAG: hypothetical protein QNK37_15435, partial [Acidobacteriota bacterium]|nr:hypothetical protein [Acidobacteriota bacterium]
EEVSMSEGFGVTSSLCDLRALSSLFFLFPCNKETCPFYKKARVIEDRMCLKINEERTQRSQRGLSVFIRSPIPKSFLSSAWEEVSMSEGFGVTSSLCDLRALSSLFFLFPCNKETCPFYKRPG